MPDAGRFLLFVIQPFRRRPGALDGWTLASAAGDFFLSGTPAFAIWKLVDAERGDLLARVAQVSAVMVVCGVIWAGYRLMRVLSSYERPALRVTKAYDFDQWTWHDGKQVRSSRTAQVQVETAGGDVDHVRLNLLRFTPQGRAGAIFLRERHDISTNYVQSRIEGYPVQRGAPAVFDLCFYMDPIFQRRGTEKPLMAILYAVDPNLEPNAIEADRRYFFEVQALSAAARSQPTTFFAEVDANGDLQSGPAPWPA